MNPENNKSAGGNYRWIICGLLLFSTTVNYMDRQVIGYLKHFFCSSVETGGFGWKDSDFANITSAFTEFYAGMTVLAGWVIDRIGTKLGLALSLIFWSLFGMLNAAAGSSKLLHVIIRSAFGAGEAGNFPASIKTVAEWFPKRERALATGIFNSGSNLGAMLAAIFVPLCMSHYGDQAGWKMAYILTGAIGFVWLIFWFWLYDSPKNQKRLSKAEYEYIHNDDEVKSAKEEVVVTAKVPWGKLLGYRQTWAFFFGKFFTDGIWWFYLFWLPDYLEKQFGMTKKEIIIPSFTVYGIAIIGSVFGGSLPLFLMKRGMKAYTARMTAMLMIAVVPMSVLLTQYFGDVSRFGNNAMILAVSMICIGAAAHQAWSANLFTTVSDMFPKKAVGSVTGIGAMAGGLGGVLVQQLKGKLGDAFQSHPQTGYWYMFLLCGFSYVLAWTLMKILVPRHRPITDL